MPNKLLPILTLLLLFISCSSDSVTNADSEVKPEEESLGENLESEEIAQFSALLHSALVSNDNETLISYIRKRNLDKKLVLKLPLIQNLFSASQMESKFINYYLSEDTTYLIFRTFSPPQMIYFYEFSIIKESNAITIVDVLDVSTNTSLNDLEDEVYNQIEFMDTLFAVQDSLNVVTSIENLKYAYSQINKNFILAKYPRYKQYLERDLIFLSDNSPVYNAYFTELLKNAPKDSPHYYYALFYLSSLIADYNQALLAAENLEKFSGKDIFLDYIKAQLLFFNNNFEESLTVLNSILFVKDDFSDAYVLKTFALAEIGNIEAALETLLVFDSKVELTKSDLDYIIGEYPVIKNDDNFNLLQEKLSFK